MFLDFGLDFLIILIWSTALLVNFAINPIFSAIYLILTFLLSSLLLFNVGLVLISYIYIMVYVGAIAILFLFIVMLLDLHKSGYRENVCGFFYNFHIFVLFGLFYFLIRESLVDLFCWNNQKYDLIFGFNESVLKFFDSNLGSVDINRQLGHFLYSEYGFLVLFLGLILFLAMVFAIYMVKAVKPVVFK